MRAGLIVIVAFCFFTYGCKNSKDDGKTGSIRKDTLAMVERSVTGKIQLVTGLSNTAPAGQPGGPTIEFITHVTLIKSTGGRIVIDGADFTMDRLRAATDKTVTLRVKPLGMNQQLLNDTYQVFELVEIVTIPE